MKQFGTIRLGIGGNYGQSLKVCGAGLTRMIESFEEMMKVTDGGRAVDVVYMGFRHLKRFIMMG